MSEDDIRTEGQQDSCGVEEASATSAGASGRTPIMRMGEAGYNGNAEYPYITHVDGRQVSYSLESRGVRGFGGEQYLVMRATLDDGSLQSWTVPEPIVDYSNEMIGRGMAALARQVRSIMRAETDEDRTYFAAQQAERDRQDRERYEQRRAQMAAQIAQRTEEERVAKERARETLRSFLTEEQRAQYAADGYFDVLGSSGVNYYRIHPKAEGNVVLLDEKRKETDNWFCAGPRQYSEGFDELPLPDIMLAQLLILSADELDYFRKANLYKGRRWPINIPGLRDVLHQRGYVYTDEDWARGGVRTNDNYCPCAICR